MPNRSEKYLKENLAPLVKSSRSMAEVIKKLGLKLSGGTYQLIQTKIKILKLDTSHFTGRGWAKGLTSKSDVRIKNIRQKNSRSDDELFASNTEFYNKTYRNRLLELGWKYECKICLLDNWLGNPLTLHLDHINGDRTDNRKENLRFLCPNCHQQTETWGR